MAISTQSIRQHLQAFDFKRLFVESTPDGLGWNNYTSRLQSYDLDGVRYNFTPIAEQGGMVIVQCEANDGNIPFTGARRKIDKHITELAFEHIIIFVDGDKSTSLWVWVKREDGKSKSRTHTYRKGQLADALLQKLAGIAFDIKELDDEGKVSIAAVTSKVKKAFDVETVTKKFYDQFKTEHSSFLKFLQGVQDTAGRDWYASVMLNRLMFLYFIQQKGFLNGDTAYLQTKLEAMQGEGRNYYHEFLLPLFFEGLACEESERTADVNRLLGKIPYLNGGLFLPHVIEDEYGEQIQIADEAFVRLFRFFDDWDWHLDVREHRAGNEINPDVLGYIFEKYINQKEMGAYYTKEDITGYICKNTILPFLLDKAGLDVKAAMRDIEPYIYDAVSTTDYLPTETEREYTARRKRYEQIKTDFAAGKIASVNDLVTYNLDIIAFAEDWLRGLDDSTALGYFYFDCLTKLTVLDPTCGSGAFLFAAMNILEPLYELALDKMRRYADPVRHLAFVDELKRVDAHPNRRYFVYKSIIVNNLYGVDLMEEAVEICKLRLFLKLVAEIEDVKQIEPLPDIDFNIRAGNTLVGFATQSEIHGRLFATEELKRKVTEADRALTNFRQLQTRLGISAQVFKKAKADIEDQMDSIRDDLDQSLMEDYGQSDLMAFRKSHQPFHWYVEFNHVIANGGFDVIVGNPPYVEYSKIKEEYTVQNYITLTCNNLWAYTLERSRVITRNKGRFGLIVPMSLVCADRMQPLQKLLESRGVVWISNYESDSNPGQLFDGVKQNVSIVLYESIEFSSVYTTRQHRFFSEARDFVFYAIEYAVPKQNYIGYGFPKVGQDIEIKILDKIFRHKPLSYQMTRSGKAIYVHRIAHYYIKCFDFIPYFRSDRDGIKKSEDYKVYLFPSPVEPFVAAINSSIFYFYWQVFFDSFKAGKFCVESFPISPFDSATSAKLTNLAGQLMKDMRSKSTRLKAKYARTGNVEYDQFFPRLSKPMMDDIDHILANHYGFSEEELEFIINYDIKYRMGKDAESDDAEMDDA
jgi:tRNA1(Val) A37 N6-methylase TrmN6